jgi:exonuclease III
MKSVGWNCQGMKTSPAIRALLDLQREINPDVIFLSESHLDRAKAEKLVRKLKFGGMLIHENDGRSGGLLLMWKKETKIVEKDITANYIDVVVDC